MNDAKFTELVNLYLDREISSADITLLRDALIASPARKREFEARARLHQAMRIAVAPEARQVAHYRELIVQKTIRASRITIGVLGSGIAACMIFGVVLLRPVIQESSSVIAKDEFSEIAVSDIARFAASKGHSEWRRGSLASELRLMGLTPDSAPIERQLRGVDVEALRQREARRQREIERMNQYQSYMVMPESRLFESVGPPVGKPHTMHDWPVGFESSLASF
jgi:hypothetical protein